MSKLFLCDSLSEIWSTGVGKPVAEVAVESEVLGVCPWTAKEEGCIRFASGALSLEAFMLTFILHCQELDQFNMLHTTKLTVFNWYQTIQNEIPRLWHVNFPTEWSIIKLAGFRWQLRGKEFSTYLLWILTYSSVSSSISSWKAQRFN